jgi:hypothetical protein
MIRRASSLRSATPTALWGASDHSSTGSVTTRIRRTRPNLPGHFDSDLIAEGDYGTLMNVLQTAFEETGQPLPGRRGVSIWYVEDGFQTVPPPEKSRFYRGRENDGHALPAIAARTERQDGAVDQASQLRDAILLAYCQPSVSGFPNFGLLDEDRLGGWQSGLLWRDGTRKPSYDIFKEAIAEVRRRDTDCSNVKGTPQD